MRNKRQRILLIVLGIWLLIPLRSSATSWIIPGVTHLLPGEPGRIWHSSMTIANPNAEPVRVTLFLIPAAGTAAPQPATYTVPARQSRTFYDFFGSVWGLWKSGASGAIRVDAERPIGLFATTSNTRSCLNPNAFAPRCFGLSAGTALPVIEEGRLLRSGQIGHAGWVSHSADPTTGFRTNVAVVFPDEGGGAATVKLYDDRGTLLGSRSYDFPLPTFVQEGLGAYTSLGLPVGRVELQVTRGKVSAYTAVVDNVSTDFSVFAADVLPQQGLNAVLSGVAKTRGEQNSYWRTDARFSNPNPTGNVEITVYFLRAFEDPATALSASLTVLGGQTIEVRDVLGSLWEAPEGSFGALVLRASAPIVALARTVNSVPPPLSADTGWTYSFQQSPTVFDSFLAPADGVAVLEGMTHTSSRTNILGAAGLSGAQYTLQLLSSSGELLGTARESLPPLGWQQRNLREIFPSAPKSSFDGWLLVSVQAGSADFQSVRVDAISGDAVMSRMAPSGTGSGAPVTAIPIGRWGRDGAPGDPREGLSVTEHEVRYERFCRSGRFNQPLLPDPSGRFDVPGSFLVEAGPGFAYPARFMGATDGRTLTLTITPTGEGGLDTGVHEVAFILGKPYTVETPCPLVER